MQARTDFAQSLAVVIGIDAYTHGIPPLRTAANDARKLAQLLQDHHGYTTHCLLDDQATAEHITHLLKTELPQHLTPDDRLLFYFAGHGVALDSDEGPRGYLLPHNAHREDPDSFLRMHEVHQALNGLDCRHLLVILDSCFSGAFRWSATRSSFVASNQVLYRERYDRFIQDPAWQVLTSASYDQTASDQSFEDRRGQVGDHSPFAHALFEALETDAADRFGAAEGGDGVITAEELYLYLEQAVQPSSEVVGRRQTPELWTLERHDKGQFIFHVPGHEVALEPAPALAKEANPYQGLSSYEAEHAALFFGRDAVIEELYRYVEEHALTVVLGASGTGKSSVVKAGLVPKLEADVERRWQVVYDHYVDKETKQEKTRIVRPGQAPLATLWRVVARLGEASPAHADIEEGITAWCNHHPEKRLVLVIDQFEELVTMTRKAKERRAVLDLLVQLLKTYPKQLRVIVTLRTDFEPQFTDSALKDHWQAARYIVPPMSREDLRQVIEGPASLMVVYFDPSALVETLVDEVAATPGGLPLLSFTLSEMYARLHRRFLTNTGINRSLTESDHKALGGVVGALRQRADEEYEALDAAHQKTMRRVMLRMVAFDGGTIARQRVFESDLQYPDIEEKNRVKAVLDRLTDAQVRLLVTGQEDDSERYYEPAHDALVRAWDRLLGWIHAENEGAANLRYQQSLALAARDWDETQTLEGPRSAQGKLWRDAVQAGSLAKLLRDSAAWMNQREVTFARKSIQRWRRFLIGLAVTAVVIVVFGVGAVFFAFQSRGNLKEAQRQQGIALANADTARVKADEARINAERALSNLQEAVRQQGIALANADTARSRQLAAQARTTLETQLDQAFLLAIEAYRTAATVDARSSLLAALQYNPGLEKLLPGDGGAVISVALNLDGTRLAYAGRSIGLWDMETDRLLTRAGGARSVAFSPDGDQLAAVGDDGQVRLLDGHSGALRPAFNAQSGRIFSVAFSPDGSYLATGSLDKMVRVWDIKTDPPTLRHTLNGPVEVHSVAFSPRDGTLAASSNFSPTVHRWDVESGTQRAPLQAVAAMASVAFNADGTRLTAGGRDGTVHLWNTETEPPRLIFTGKEHAGDVLVVAFAPAGNVLVSGGQDETIILREAATGKPIGQPLRGHTGPVTSVAFSADGHRMVAGSEDQKISVWSLEKGQALAILEGSMEHVRSVAFSPDGQRLAAGSCSGFGDRCDNSKGALWKVEEGKPFTMSMSLEESMADAVSVAFSADGQRAVGSEGGTIRLWDQGALRHTLQAHTDQVNSVAFSPDGTRLASGGCQQRADNQECKAGALRLWDLTQSPPSSTVLQGHTNEIWSVAFSMTGDTLASGGYDGTLRLWGARQGTLLRTLNAQYWVLSVAFSPDGKHLASGGRPHNTKTLLLWDLTTETPQSQTLEGHDDWVQSVAFSPDGKYLASSSGGESDDDYTIRLWDVETGVPLGRPFLGHTGTVRSVAFSPDGTFLASGSDDRMIRLWDVDVASWQANICRIANRNLTQAEWGRFIGQGVSYQCTCPGLPAGAGAPPDASRCQPDS